MPSSIGIRTYQFFVHPRGSSNFVAFDSEELASTVPDFLKTFSTKHNQIVQNDEFERSWYFDCKHIDKSGNTFGYIRYGTFGFEADFIDSKTKEKNYKRKTTDVEEIPLFYEFWFPEKQKFGLSSFQSFQGRSCITLVMEQLKEEFENANPDYSILFRKIMPGGLNEKSFKSAPVKQFRLIRRNAPSDAADKYLRTEFAGAADIEIIISARRRKSLGNLGSIVDRMKNVDGYVTYDGIDFPEAIAEVRIGNRNRKVGVLGYNGEAGVIDITNDIERGADGHPTLDSLKRESDRILTDIFSAIKGKNK